MKVKKIVFRVEIFKEEDVYVSLCPGLNVSSFGENIEDAKRLLQEAVEGFLQECEEMGTLEEVLEKVGFIKEADIWTSREPIMEDKLAVSR